MHHTNRIYCLELLEHWKLIQFKIQQNNIDRKKNKREGKKEHIDKLWQRFLQNKTRWKCCSFRDIMTLDACFAKPTQCLLVPYLLY